MRRTLAMTLCGVVFGLVNPAIGGTVKASAKSVSKSAPKSFYEFTAEGMDGKPRPLSEYQGKVALVVNTASQCGYTSQYKNLQAMYDKYKEKGFIVLAFPSNDFGGQEPGSNTEIQQFCERKFKVSFPMFSKNPVVGKGKQPIYEYLTEVADPKFGGEVKWNFEKFLIDRQGKVVARYPSSVTPDSADVEEKIKSLL